MTQSLHWAISAYYGQEKGSQGTVMGYSCCKAKGDVPRYSFRRFTLLVQVGVNEILLGLPPHSNARISQLQPELRSYLLIKSGLKTESCCHS